MIVYKVHYWEGHCTLLTWSHYQTLKHLSQIMTLVKFTLVYISWELMNQSKGISDTYNICQRTTINLQYNTMDKTIKHLSELA